MRWLSRTVGVILVVIVVAFVYQRLFGDRSMTPHLVSSTPVAVIGIASGEPVAVAGDGTVLAWLPVPEESTLPSLPLDAPPEGARLGGPVLDQVRVLAAAPSQLRPYVERSFYGEGGVGIELSTGIELRFGSSSQAARKWKAAAAVLAEPSVTTLDYVDLLAPSHPAVGGSGHALPPIP